MTMSRRALFAAPALLAPLPALAQSTWESGAPEPEVVAINDNEDSVAERWNHLNGNRSRLHIFYEPNPQDGKTGGQVTLRLGEYALDNPKVFFEFVLQGSDLTLRLVDTDHGKKIPLLDLEDYDRESAFFRNVGRRDLKDLFDTFVGRMNRYAEKTYGRDGIKLFIARARLAMEYKRAEAERGIFYIPDYDKGQPARPMEQYEYHKQLKLMLHNFRPAI